MPDFEDHRTKAALAPADRTKLFRIVVPLVDQVRLVEYILSFFEADAMFFPDLAAFVFIELEPHVII